MIKFTCDVKVLNNALQRIKTMADTTANPNYVMLTIEGGKLRAVVTDGVIAYLEDIDIMLESNDEEFTKSVFELSRLSSVVASGVASDGLEAEPLVVEISKEFMRVESEKFITVKETKRSVSKIIHKISREDPDADRRFSVYNRVRYKEDITDVEDFDSYESGEMINIIGKMQSEDKNANVYISAQDGLVRSRNNVSIKIVHIPVKNYGVAMKCSFAAKVMDIFNRIAATNILINTDKEKGYCVFTDEERNCYVWYAMDAGKKGDKLAFDSIDKMDISDIKARVCKPAFIAGLDTMKLSDTEKVNLEIVESEDDDSEYAFKITSIKGGSSIISDVRIAIDSLRVVEGVNPTEFKVTINVNEIRNIASKCDNNWILMAFQNTEDSSFMKMVDMKQEEVTGEYKEFAVYYTMVGV